MFKKNAWIVGLLAALAIMFVGCVEPEAEEEGGEIVEIAKLSTVIAGVADGVITDWGKIFDGTPFMKAGSPKVEIITEGGVKKLKLSEFGANWGVGLDVRHVATDDGNSGIGFRKGDQITVKGKATPVDCDFYVNVNIASVSKLENWVAGAESFDKTLTLGAADVGTIKTATPQGVRLHFASGDRGFADGVIILEEIIVTGNRTEADDPSADEFIVSDRLQVANWVGGLTIKPKAGKSAGAITQYYEGVAPTTYAKSTNIPQAVGTYKVTFDIAAAKGFNAATGLDAGNMKVLVKVSAPKEIKDTDLAAKIKLYNGGAWDNNNSTLQLDSKIVGPDGKDDWVFIRSGTCVPASYVTITPLALRTFVAAATPRYCLEYESDWRDYSFITVTFDMINTSAAGTEKAQLIARRNRGPYAWADGDVSYLEYTLPASGITTKSETFKVDDLDNDPDDSGMMLGPNNNTAFLLKVTSVKYHNE